jgi:hypothetical protein
MVSSSFSIFPSSILILMMIQHFCLDKLGLFTRVLLEHDNMDFNMVIVGSNTAMMYRDRYDH